MASHLSNFPDDPFKRLKGQIRLYMKEEMISEKMLGVVKDAYTEFLRSRNIILSRTEQTRLLRAVLQEMFDDMSTNL
jgi:hypothetical protein